MVALSHYSRPILADGSTPMASRSSLAAVSSDPLLLANAPESFAHAVKLKAMADDPLVIGVQGVHVSAWP